MIDCSSLEGDFCQQLKATFLQYFNLFGVRFFDWDTIIQLLSKTMALNYVSIILLTYFLKHLSQTRKIQL
jgi:hypothetical protein